MRRFLLVLASLAALALLLFGWGFLNARADPLVRRESLALPDWPVGAPPVRVVLFSDVHIASATMDSARLARIVGQVNALRPDLVLIAGDFASGHDSARAAEMARGLSPLAGLRTRLGVIATFGNHDHWTDPALIRRALEAAKVTVLDNQAVQRGPLAIGGAGDAYTHHQDMPALIEAMRPLTGARIVLTHSPDLAPQLPADMALLLAGHTHCGQIVLPLYGPVTHVAAPRYRCGIIHEKGRTVVVTGGLGTSTVPLRFGAPPDLWVLTLGPAPRR
ncbi:MAG: metallophosphoesterase [Sphingomonas sp.]|uniref:metallophosphoesterase n=1 Tax=Sphingomonas sp. TaxID=28214 RepID=UPI0035632065